VDFHGVIEIMSGIAQWLMTLVGPMVLRAVISLGFTTITFAGVTALVNSLVASAQSQWSSLPVAVLQLASLSGIPESLGMILGAYIARVAMWQAVAGAKYVLKGKS
jgi:hypothetical protein